MKDINQSNCFTPDRSKSELIKELARKLNEQQTIELVLKDSLTGESVTLPPSATELLAYMMTVFAQGRSLLINPIEPEISTKEAAEILKVSHPYLNKLLDDGAIPHRLLGVHRRILLEDLLQYKSEVYDRQVKGMAELTALSQELGLYDEVE